MGLKIIKTRENPKRKKKMRVVRTKKNPIKGNAAFVRGVGSHGKIYFYTGRAGQGFVSKNIGEAFLYGSIEEARRRAENLNRMQGPEGIRFIAVDAARYSRNPKRRKAPHKMMIVGYRALPKTKNQMRYYFTGNVFGLNRARAKLYSAEDAKKEAARLGPLLPLEIYAIRIERA